MRLSRPVSHVIFDMDGCLLDTERFYTEVTQRIVGRFGKTYDWSVKSHMVGRPAIESARFLVETLELPISAEEYLVEREAELEALFADSEPMPGAKELTLALHAAGVSQALATSTVERLFAIKTGRHAEWFRVFSTIVTGDDPRIERGKPAPDIFLVTARELGVEPSACVVIEDSPAGVAAGQAAGMQVVAVPYPGLDPALVERADLVVRSMTELEPEDLGFAGPRR
jgi:pseudouridine-5'-monophosphatase